MIRFSALLTLLSLPVLAAESATAAVVVVDTGGAPDATVKRVVKATESSLKQLSGLQVVDSPLSKRDARKSCEPKVGPEACLKQLSQASGADFVVLLNLKASRDSVAFDITGFLDGNKTNEDIGELQLESPDEGLKPALEAVLPAWARKGWGGLQVEAESGAVVKLDGRAVEGKTKSLSIPAGTHQLDVVFPDGSALLQRVDVAEGKRSRVSVEPVAPLSEGVQLSSGSGSALRYTGYALWMAGALAVGGGFIAGALSRGTGVGANACSDDTRTCITLEEAQRRQGQAQAYATTGNVLFGTGLALLLAGAGLFVFDLF